MSSREQHSNSFSKQTTRKRGKIQPELNFAPPSLPRPPSFLIFPCHYPPTLASQLISVLLNVKLGRGLRSRRFSFLSFNLPLQFANGIDIDFVGRLPRREWWSAPPPLSRDGQQLPAMTYFQLCFGDKHLKTWLGDYYGAKGLIHQGFWTSYAGWEHWPVQFMFSHTLRLPFISLFEKIDVLCTPNWEKTVAAMLICSHIQSMLIQCTSY